MERLSSDNIYQGLYDFIIKNFPAARQSTLQDTDHLLEKRVIDSLGILEIISYIESSFGITVKEIDMINENFGTIRNIVSFVCRSLEEQYGLR